MKCLLAVALLLLPHCQLTVSFSLSVSQTITSRRRPLFILAVENESESETPKMPSKRSMRKAAQRDKKKMQAQKSSKRNNNKSTSSHPEAILKRRQSKELSRRKHNFSSRQYLSTDDAFTSPMDRSQSPTNINIHPDADPHHTVKVHTLHSEGVKRLDCNTTAEEVVRAIKRAQNLHDLHDVAEIAHFLVEEVDPSFAYGYRGSLLSRLAVASLHLNNIPIATRCITERRIHHRSSMLPLESAAIVRGLTRCHCIREAWEVLEDELSLPLNGWVNFDLTTTDSENADDNHLEAEDTRRRLETKERLIYRARGIGSIISRHLYEEEPTAALAAIDKLKSMGQIVNEAGLIASELEIPWEKLVRGAAFCESRRRDGAWKTLPEDSVELPTQWPCNLVYPVLDAMIAFPSDNNDRTFEALCNALVRRTVFVTGAVDMKGCPKADRGECAFIGRSNVGKSSLVNMLTNRKSLAFTSKTPGKTQQFNYFAVNDKPDLERQIRYGDEVGGSKDRDSFYIVDLPGFGFAKVPQKQRQQWSDFMEEYFGKRDNLKVVFHLIDARHGPTEEDGKIMQKVGDILHSDKTTYVVVLTKADKNVKGADSEKNPGKVSDRVWEKLLQTMQANRVGYAPIVLTSANTRLGRDEVWKYLRLAAEV